MFKRLFSWWKEDVLLGQALEESALVLEKAGNMFSFAMSVLFEEAGDEERIYDMDREVNDLQTEIRKKVLEHLAIHPRQDITASLVLITIVIDVERIGDLAKNIVELRRSWVPDLADSKYVPEVRDIRGKLERSLAQTKEAFVAADADKAKEPMAECTWIGHKCDTTLEQLAGDETLKVREAVVYGLLFRYLKRISGHARNVCSSVVNPFHRLGYKPE